MINGSLEILGMRIGYTDDSFSKYLYSSYSIEVGENCYYVNNVLYDGLDACNVIFLTGNGFITGFNITKMFYNKKDAEKFYNMLYNTIHNTSCNENKEIRKPIKNDAIQYNHMYVYRITNNLTKAVLIFQDGATNDNNKFFVSLRINSILSEVADSVVPEKMLSSLSNLYVNSEYNMTNKKIKIDYYKIFKCIIAVIALYLFYLYILNDRYYVGNHGNTITDKWTQTKIICTKNTDYYKW